MHITILNGDMSAKPGTFSSYLKQLTNHLEGEHKVDHFHLNSMDLHYCSGCFNCWWKTPGECVHKDQGEEIFRSVINSDFFILASPLKAGFTSSALKKITDRLIVLLMPYIKEINGEYHHQKRYEKYPDFGLLLQKDEDTDAADFAIINNIYDRLAINFHSKRRFTLFTDEASFQEVLDETRHLQRIA